MPEFQAKTRQLWDMLPEESSWAYHCFSKYLSMTDCEGKRSIRKLPELLGRPAVYERQLEYYSSRHQWVKRSRAYDEYLEKYIRGIV